ncbi:hypothetical protein [Nostoc sp. FACHB-110]|uniref:hypothetical protein n=1 Tax=Nostoc sp. FACHB-110 TaxID=2692834 RepID=UPI001685C5F8|nr:hypothetical protein [Nostoc sp. FACHB-110]MBD2440106.1 hypothetical protein [Nostoc sp. FACHB-110]
MKAQITAALIIVAAVASLELPVNAQSTTTPSVNGQNYKVTSDSLEGIGDRTAQEDFKKFFEGGSITNISNNNQPVKSQSNNLRLNQSLSLPSTPIYLEPAQSTDTNDGLQVQLDLGS